MSKELQQRARQFRREMISAERLLWKALRDRRIGGFRRQDPLHGFILDFYSPRACLCIEVDGGIHDQDDQLHRDRARTEVLLARGIRVLRLRNEEVLHDLRSVPLRIEAEVARVVLSSSPLPHAGEGGEPKRAG